jgi:hypothetical protein
MIVPSEIVFKVNEAEVLIAKIDPVAEAHDHEAPLAINRLCPPCWK